jgi:IS5 family transposase
MVLSALYNLSDDQIEYQVRDRLSFMRFLGLRLEDSVPDAKTVWLYRDALAKAGMMEALFTQFDGHLARQGYIARGGQILDGERVTPPVRVTRERSFRCRATTTPAMKTTRSRRARRPRAGPTDKPAMRSQKDTDARWTKKHGKSHYGYKNHVNVDRTHKLVRRYHVSDAALHDRWDGCRPPQTASQCAKVVVLKATKLGGRRDEGYDNRGGFGKAGFPSSWSIDCRAGEVPEEADTGAVSALHVRATRLHCRVRSLRQRERLGIGDGSARPRSKADCAAIRSGLCEAAEKRCG